jgi:hypothetical protein
MKSETELAEDFKKLTKSIASEMDPNALYLPMVGLSKQVTLEEDLCPCGKESELGAHGITEGIVYSEFWCLDCWNKKE